MLESMGCRATLERFVDRVPRLRAYSNGGRYLTDQRSREYPNNSMRSTNEHSDDLDGAYYRELRLLEEVDTSQDLSQRKLANRLGIALGVANVLVRKVAQKGYIRISQRGWRRWAYALTPSGVARKVQLTRTYIENILDHYRQVRSELREELSSLPLSPDSRVAIVGTSGLAELAYLALLEIGVTEIEVFSDGAATKRFLGKDVLGLATIEPRKYAKVVIAVSRDTDGPRSELISRGVAREQIVEPFSSGRDVRTAEAGLEVS